MKWMLSVAIAAGLTAGAAFSATPARPGIPGYVAKAVADPARGDDVNNDARRKVAELVAFSGAKPGDNVLELIPGSGYFTKVFSKVVGPKGHVYALWPKPYDDESHPDSDVMRKLATQPGFSNIETLVQPADKLTADCYLEYTAVTPYPAKLSIVSVLPET